MAYTSGFSVTVGNPTKASDVGVLSTNDDFLKTAIDKIMSDSATPGFALVDGVTATTQSAANNSTKLATTAYADAAGASLTGTTNNTVVTVTAANAMQGEANLTFDGSTLTVTGAADVSGDFTAGTVNADSDTAASDNAAMGYTAAEGLILTGQGSTNDVTIKNDADGTVLEIATGGTDVEVTSGNLIIGTSGKGIDFSATADAGGMTSEVLDDYEEGTFTPIVKYSTSSYALNWEEAEYVKVGNLVYFQLGVDFDASASNDSSVVYVYGLPYTSYNSTASHVRYFAAWEYFSGGPVGTFYLNVNNTYLTSYTQKQDGNAPANIESSQVYRASGGNQLFMAGTYMAA
ncbi:hypothetical protein CMI37_08140 [Candidatus Pacearchaeota archaeon]|nr:hypothetical protein [Candidatus Pacearchaeota archaeon]